MMRIPLKSKRYQGRWSRVTGVYVQAYLDAVRRRNEDMYGYHVGLEARDEISKRILKTVRNDQ